MQTMSIDRVRPVQGAHLPDDVDALLCEADPYDIDRLFDQLREALTRPVVAPAMPEPAHITKVVPVVRSTTRPPVARRRRIADPIAFGMVRVVLPFGLLIAGLVGLMAFVG